MYIDTYWRQSLQSLYPKLLEHLRSSCMRMVRWTLLIHTYCKNKYCISCGSSVFYCIFIARTCCSCYCWLIEKTVSRWEWATCTCSMYVHVHHERCVLHAIMDSGVHVYMYMNSHDGPQYYKYMFMYKYMYMHIMQYRHRALTGNCLAQNLSRIWFL